MYRIDKNSYYEKQSSSTNSDDRSSTENISEEVESSAS